MSSDASSTGSAPRQKQSPQLQSSGEFGLCSPLSDGCGHWLHPEQATLSWPIPLARQPPKMHWNGQSTTNADSKIEMWLVLFNS